MDSPQKLAFIVQSNRLQGLIWQALLKSQKVAVIFEPGSADLAECINQIAMAGLTLPDVIILDSEAAELNPYEFCRWCREAFPKIPIFLTRFRNLGVSSTERRWAMQQGATDFLDGFQRDNLMGSAADNLRCIFSALEQPFLDEKALLTVLLNIRRQLSQAQPPAQATATPATKFNGGKSNGKSSRLASVNGKTADPSEPSKASSDRSKFASPDDMSWVPPGLRSLDKENGKAASKSLLFPPPAAQASALPKKDADPPVEGTAVRRYRGVVY